MLLKEVIAMIHPDVEKHLKEFDPSIKERYLQIRQFILDQTPHVTEKLGYGVPGYYMNDKNILYVACFIHHIGIYPGYEFIEKYKNSLKEYKTSKGTIQISHNQDIPFDLIKSILKEKGFSHD